MNDDTGELKGSVYMAAAMIGFVVLVLWGIGQAVMFFDPQPTQVLPAAGERSVLIEEDH